MRTPATPGGTTTDTAAHQSRPLEGWTLVLPQGWVSLRTEPGGRDRDIKDVLDRRFRGLHRDELVRERIDLDRALREAMAQADRAGAQMVHLLTATVANLPVSAILLMSVTARAEDDDALARGLEALVDVRDEDVVEADIRSVAGLPAARQRRHRRAPVGGDDGPTAWHTHVDYIVAAGEEQLVLMFTTVTEPLAGPLVEVFDAIASTLHHSDRGPDLEWPVTRG